MSEKKSPLESNKLKGTPKFQRGYILIDEERCKGCDLCIPICPVDIIFKSGSDSVNSKGWIPVHVEGMQRCTACKLCAVVCPDQAIDVFQFSKPIPIEAAV